MNKQKSNQNILEENKFLFDGTPLDSNFKLDSQIKEKLLFLLEKGINSESTDSSLSDAEMQEFIEIVANVCHNQMYPYISIKTPQMCSVTNESACLGSFLMFEEDFDSCRIKITTKFRKYKYESNYPFRTSKVEYIEPNKDLMQIINTIGHEMKHFSQYFAEYKFKYLPEKLKKKVSKQLKESFRLYNAEKEIEKDHVKIVHEVLGNFTNREYLKKHTENKDDFEVYVEDVSFASYLTQLAEIEARVYGFEFGNKFLDIIDEIIKNEPEKIANLEMLKNWVEKQRTRENKQFDENDRATAENKTILKDFRKEHKLNIIELIKFIKLQEELFNKNISNLSEDETKLFECTASGAYKFAIEEQMRDRNIIQKIIFLKLSLLSGFTNTVRAVLDSIVDDASYQELKTKINPILLQFLLQKKSKEISRKANIPVNIPTDYQYSKIFNNDQLKKLVLSYINNWDLETATSLLHKVGNQQIFTVDEVLDIVGKRPKLGAISMPEGVFFALTITYDVILEDDFLDKLIEKDSKNHIKHFVESFIIKKAGNDYGDELLEVLKVIRDLKGAKIVTNKEIEDFKKVKDFVRKLKERDENKNKKLRIRNLNLNEVQEDKGFHI